jgi:hypothetical protein
MQKAYLWVLPKATGELNQSSYVSPEVTVATAVSGLRTVNVY